MIAFTKEELIRYSRQLMLPEVGLKGQEKFRNAKVLVIGAGGLGCPALLYLAAAGVGIIGIIDFDKIELHNLHRQVLYTVDDVGKPKAEIAAAKIKRTNPYVSCEVFDKMLDETNAEEIISKFDVVLDGSDNFMTRYIVNDACVKTNKPLVYGSIFKSEGQLTVFNYMGSKNLRDLYPEAPDPEDVPNCSEIGVMGVIPAIIGTMMCEMALKVLLGTCMHSNTLFVFNFNNYEIKKLKF